VALEYQTAISEVLNVILHSPSDVQPVLDAIAETAHRLCHAEQAYVMKLADGSFVMAAGKHAEPDRIEYLRQHPVAVDRGSISGRAAIERRTIHIVDAMTDPEYTLNQAGHISPCRTLLGVPLMREGEAIGVIVLTRAIVQPFTERQIDLITIFADQALIAIENARLFEAQQARTRELTESLEQQTATADMLKVISRSTFDLQTVLDTLAQSAAKLCEADHVWLYRRDGEVYRWVASYGHSKEEHETIKRYMLTVAYLPGRGSVIARTLLENQPVQIADVLADPEYTLFDLQKIGNYRTALAIPLLREGASIGTLTMTRSQVRPFSDKQIELAATFADQAAIAIENVRLFNEVQTRTRELARSVEELRALGDVSQAVNSTLDLETVLETIVGRAVQLSSSDSGIVYEFDEVVETFHARASHRITPEHLATLRAAPIRLGEGAVGRAGAIWEPVQVADIADERQFVAPQTHDLLIREGLRSLLAIPLVRDQRVLGGLVILRRELGTFSPEIVATLQTFAAQSVLAIQNARLFREIEKKSRELELEHVLAE
jgi:GAF domain-containing protein